MIYITRPSNNLEEVTVNGQTKLEDLEEIRRNYRGNGSFYEGKPPLSLIITNPLTFIYELDGKTPAKARRYKRYYDNEPKLMRINLFFNKTLISKYTDLEGERLNKFMLSYSPKPEMAQNWSKYDALNNIDLSEKNRYFKN